jgi:filamentous hemagglutinin family protein
MKTFSLLPRIVFALGRFMAALAAVSLLRAGPPPPAQLPTGGQVVAGAAGIAQSGATMNITQTTQRAAINWQSFNLGSQATVHFEQPSAASVTLNRVLDGNPSQIFGRITAPGQVFLSNPNGMIFAPGASVDVGGFLATSGSISDADFMAGRDRFTRQGATGGIVNDGELKAGLGGYIALLAPEVRNNGVIVAQLGTVALAAGDAYELQFDNHHTLANIIIQPATIKALIDNGNAVQAPGGRIILSAVAADRLQGGVVNNRGAIEANSLTNHGGVIRLEGDAITLASGSTLNASGATGGGAVLVGGDWQGSGDMAHATTVTLETGARIDASATGSGNGGKVVLWSDVRNPDSVTHVAGDIFARGAQGGQGGQIETSGHALGVSGTVNTGPGGQWLLDPHNLTINASTGTAALGDVAAFDTSPSTDSIITPDTITTATNAGTDVTLQASNDIFVNSSIVSSNPGGDGGALTFQAGRSITLNANVNSDNGNVSFTVNDGTLVPNANRDAGAAVFQNNSLIDAGSGDVAITMGDYAGQSGAIATGQITASNLTITHNGPTAGAVTGQIDLGETDLLNNLTITANAARNVVNTIGNVIPKGTSSISVGTGDVTIDRPTTDFNIISLVAGNVSLADTNAMKFGTVDLTGNLSESTRGPISSTGHVKVAGTSTFTVANGGYGYGDPYINLTNTANHFGGVVTLNAASTGETGTGGYVTIRDSGALTIASATTAKSLDVVAGGALTLGTTDVGTSLTATVTGPVALGTMKVGSNLNVSTSGAGAITSGGKVTVAGQATLAAGAANDVTLDNADNNFNALQISSGKTATLVDTNGIVLGATLSGDLDVTAGGDIGQNATLTVAGDTTFTANHATAQINLSLGSSNPFDANGTYANNFAGTVTLARNNSNTGFTNVYLRNINASASVLTGLTSVGTLSNVSLYFQNAPSVTLPGMTLTGSLRVNAPGVVNTATIPGNQITQTGPIVVAGDTIFAAGSTGDIDLSNADNDFANFGISNTGARNVTLIDKNAVVLYAPGYHQGITGDYTVTAGGTISDVQYNLSITGTATLNAGSNNIMLTGSNFSAGVLAIPAANNVSINPVNNANLGNIAITGSLNLSARNVGALTQVASTSVVTGSPSTNTTTFANFGNGITLAQSGNVLGLLAISGAGDINLRENDAITQASAWTFNGTNGGTNSTRRAVTLTTSDDQAITLDKTGNIFGNLTITQINNGASSAGAVWVRETGDSYFGMTEGNAWTVHGTTTIDGGAYSINLNKPGNVFGPLQVTGATGLTNGLASDVTLYASDTASADAIRDAGGTGAWNTGTGTVKLVAYDATGTTAGAGNINLSNTGNVLGDLYIKAADVTITENGSITDGTLTDWNPTAGHDTGWVTTGTTHLIVANPTGKAITLDNTTNQIGPLAVNTTGTAGTLSGVLIADNTDLTQAAVWNVGAAPVTLNATNHKIDLSTSGNILGDITITTANGLPTSVAITENDAITQAGAWVLTGVPVTLVAENDQAITLTNTANILGDLTLTGGVVSLTENDSITQGTAWTTTGTTTLNPTAHAITLENAANVLGPLAIGGTPSAVSITENSDITQASAWVQAATPFTLNAGTHDIVLSQAGNKLGDLTLTAQNATVTENDTAGITDGGAWTIPGTTTLTAGATNPIILNANPASDFGTVGIVSASNADLGDINDIVFATSTIAPGGTLTVTAGGAITQSGAITAPSLRLIGTGSATLTNVSNNVSNLAAGFSGGDLAFTNAGDFAIAVVGGTSGVTIGAHKVTLTSVAGTLSGLSNINASSTALDLTTGTALVLPQMSIAGPQTYTASTVSGTGITLTAAVTGTAAGAITFNSPVVLSADLAVQSTNSAIDFAGTVDGGTKRFTVNAGTGQVTFHDAVSNLGDTGDAGAALTLTSDGAFFNSTLGANNGLAVTGPVTFSDSVTLGDGGAASVFTGLVTLGKAGGMDLSGYSGMTFRGGVLLQNGPATINSNNSALTFQTAGTVSGPYGLTLNSGTQTLTGLDRMGTDLTSLTVTALNPIIPSGGVTIAGAQTYTATNGSSITVNGAVTSTAAGAITFNSPVLVGPDAVVTSTDSAIAFAGTVDGNKNLTVNAGTGATTFTGAIGGVSPLGSGTGASLVLQGSGATTFSSTVQTRSGVTAAGAVAFDDNVTLGNGDTGSVFSGLVTSGGSAGNSLNGYDGLAFNGGLALVGGPVSILSNGSTLSLGGAVSGAQSLTLNALAGGAGTVTGLDQIGFASDLTGLFVTGQTLLLPATGLAVAGPMSFTAPGGITINGAVGNSSGPATGQIDFNSPVLLATGPIAVTTHDGAVNFNDTVNGAQALTVNAGTGTTTFGAAVGGTTALTSVTTDAGGTTALNGGTVHTTGAQTYNDAVTLGAGTTLTGVDVQFGGTLDGAHALTVNDSGATTFAGIVGGGTALSSLVTDAAGSVVMNAASVTTTGAQTYNDAMTLGADVSFTGIGVAFNGTIDGAHGLTAHAGSGSAQFNAAVGATTALTSLDATGNTLTAVGVTTSGTQAYTANGGATLGGDLVTTNSTVTVTGPTTLGSDLAVSTGGGDIVFSGATSSINGAHGLTLTAGSGDVILGGVVGGIAPLTAVTLSGYNLTLPGIATVSDANQAYTALNDITLNQSRTLNAPVSFTADADNDGSGAFVLLNGVSLTASNNTLSIQAADLDLQGNSTLSSGSGLMSLTASGDRNLALGGSDAAGQMTISGSELSRMSSSGGLDFKTTGAGWIQVNGILATQSQNITGLLSLRAQGTGDVSFVTAASTFNAITANATGGTTNVGVNLTATNDAITFVTPVTITGASTIDSGGGAIAFQGTVAVDNDLTLSTANGALSFDGSVGGNRTLTANLGGGSVSGLGHLQGSLTGLTVNGTASITLPALTIAGPQVYNTGSITLTGDMGGVGLAFNNVVEVVPALGSALTLDAGTGTLAFSNLVSFNANNLTLTADEIDFSRAVTGTGSLVLQPATDSVDVTVGGSGAPVTGLNLTAAELARLPLDTLAGLTIGRASGTGTLDVAGPLNIGSAPLTLNGGGGITQSGGSVTSGALTLYAAGHGITLANSANAFGAVGITGTPSSLSLANAQAITQLGTAAWALGSAPVSLNAGTHDITLTNVGNTFGTLALTGHNASVIEADATDLGASALTGNLTLSSTGIVTQSGALTIGGNLDVSTTVAAGDVTIDNSGAGATTLGNTLVGGDYSITATGHAISQAAGATLQVRGDLAAAGSNIVLGGAGNLVGGTTNFVGGATTTTEVTQAGVITLGDRTETGNLTVISERTNRSFDGLAVTGDAIVLNNTANAISGSISVNASAPTIVAGADVQTGITQAPGTSLVVSGVASFTAEASSAGSLGIDLTNAGNRFGELQLSGNTVNVTNSATGLTTLGNTDATISLTLNAAGGIAQTGPISTPVLDLTAAGTVTLNNSANDVGTLAVISGGHAISYVDANDFSIAGLNAGGADVSLTAGGTGNLTQTAALQNVAELTANAGGAVTLTHSGNTIASLAASTAGTGLQVRDSADGLTVSGAVRTLGGDLEIRTSGDLTLATGGSLAAAAGDLVVSTEGAGNFINNSTLGATALTVGLAKRWLVYSDTPDLIAGAHTVKGGLASDFRHYHANYGTYAPGAVTETGNGFIYNDATPSLTVGAIIDGTASHVYGDTPTGSLGYAIVSGLVDSEDNVGNVITGGTATYDQALADTMDAGSYSINYTGGLTSNYTLVASSTGASYSVTPAVLTYNATPASRTYGAANPALTGTVTGFKLGQTASLLTGTATWTTDAVAGSNVGNYAITGAGYAAGSNYTFAQATDNATAFTVNPASLIVTANNAAKTYDSLAYNGGNGVTFGAFANGEDASVLGGTVAYSGSAQGAVNAGTYAITPSGLTSGNYTLTFVDGTLQVDKASLILTPGNVTKTYDGTLAASATAGVQAGTQLFGTDSMSGGTFAFTDANAGTHKTVTISGVTVNDGNGGGNYTVGYASNTTSTITAAPLTVSTGDVTKTYDGTLAAAGSAVVTSGTLYHNASNGNALDTLSGGTFAFTDANAGAGKTVTTSGVAVNDGNSGGNYTLSYADNTTSTINRALLTFAGTVATKAYDGTTAATLAGYTLTGFAGSETVGATLGSATFSDKNAGTGKTVTIGGLALVDGTHGGLASNYSVSPTSTATGTIEPKLLTLNATVTSKIYDGTTTAALQGFGLSGFVGSETVEGVFTGSASFADKNVGTHKAVTITGVNLVNGTNGGLASNYAVPTNAASNADITAATLHVAGVIAVDKVYDGTTDANLLTQAAALTGVIGADNVQVGSITGTYLTKDVGANKAIGTGTVVLTGTDAGNYTLVQPTGLSASITPRSLTVAASGVDKIYDSSTTATVNLTDNRIAGDTLTLSSTAAFLDKNVGVGKYISVTDITLGGADAFNYTVNRTATAFADITKALLSLTVSATGINKVYDGTTAATVTLSHDAVGGDGLTLDYGSAVFADKNVGTAKTVAVSGITLGGADAGNYSFNTTATTTADITPALITAVTGFGAANKVYDGTTTATLVTGPLGFTGMVAGDTLTASASGAAFADKNAGTGKTVAIQGLVLGGADAGNYSFNAAVTTTADITPAVITGVTGFTAANKVYDGTTGATLVTGSLGFTGMVAGDTLTASASGAAFADKNAGTGKAVTLHGLTLGGTDAGNYTVAPGAVVMNTADITPAFLTLSTASVTKTYDGLTDAAGSVRVVDGQLFAGDTVSGGTYAFADKNAGTNKTVTVAGVSVNDGNHGGNYVVSFASNTTSTITPAALTVTAHDDGKTDDGVAYVGGNGVTFSGFVPGESSSVLEGVLTYGGSAQGALNPGRYSLVPGGLTSGNNTIGYVDGMLTISPKPSEFYPLTPSVPPLSLPPPATGPVVFGDAAVSSINVFTVREASAQSTGALMVSVPNEIVAAGNGFSFSLPDSFVSGTDRASIQVTTPSGAPLPSWLRYVAATNTFHVSPTSATALPIRVLITVGTKQTIMIISEASAASDEKNADGEKSAVRGRRNGGASGGSTQGVVF